MRFAQRTHTTLPRQPPQPTYNELSLYSLRNEGLSSFIHDNLRSFDTLQLEFVAGVHAVSLSFTPSLVSVNLVRSSGIPVHTGDYLGDMLPRDGNSSETDMLVANGTRATIEVHPIVLRFPQFARSRPLPKTILKKSKTAPGQNLSWPGYTTNIMKQY